MTPKAPPDPEVEFFRDIERAFIERRGDPLFISNADWMFLAKLWKKGIPKRIVLRGITDAFDAHAHSFARKQKVRSLKFCEDQITAAVDRYRRAQQADGPSRRGLGEALLTLEAQVAVAPASPEMARAVEEGRAALRSAAESASSDRTFDAEKAVARIEDALFEAASRALGPAGLVRIETESRAVTASYQSRMPANVYETLIGESVRRKVLQHFGLPRLLLSEVA